MHRCAPRPMSTLLAAWSIGAALVVIAPQPLAQSLTISQGISPPCCGTPTRIRVSFDPASASISSYAMTFSYPPSMFASVPVVSSCFANAACSVNAGVVTVQRNSVAPATLGAEVACLLLFSAQAPVGNIPLTASDREFLSPTGQPVSGVAISGSIAVVSGGGSRPVLSYDPVPDADCAGPGTEIVFPDQSAPSTAQVTVSAVPGSPSAQGVNLDCSVSGGFSLAAGGNQFVQGASTPIPIQLRCDSSAPTSGSMQCIEGSYQNVLYHWDLDCPRPVFVNGFEAP